MPAPAITGFHHVTIAVTDLARTGDFYRDVLGLPEITPPASLTAKGQRLRWFAVGPQQLHLLETTDPEPPGRRHPAFAVPDVGAVRQHLAARGVPFRETTPIPGADRIFVDDPEGNRLELIHWPA